MKFKKISNFRRYYKNKKEFINCKNNFEVIFGRYAQRSSKSLVDTAKAECAFTLQLENGLETKSSFSFSSMYPNLIDKFKIDSNQDNIVDQQIISLVSNEIVGKNQNFDLENISMFLQNHIGKFIQK